MTLALDSLDPEWDSEYQGAAERIHEWLRDRTLLVLREVNTKNGPHSTGAAGTYVLTQGQIDHARSTAQRKAQGRQLQYPGKISGEEILRLQSEGMTRQQIANLANCSVSRLASIRRRHIEKTSHAAIPADAGVVGEL